MDLREFRKFVAFAKKSGVRAFTVGDCQVSFREDIPPVPTRKLKSVSQKDDRVVPAPDPGPTLEQINNYIYGSDESA